EPKHAAPQHDLDPVVQRVAMVEHDLRHATGPQDAMHFAYCAGGVGRVMQDAVRVDHVEALRAERQMLAIGDHEVSISTVELETMSRNLNRARRQIDASAACAATRKLQKIRTHATANLKQSRPTKTLKLH